MKTSNFSTLRKIEYPLSISQYAPFWYSGPQFRQLAPKPDLLEAYKAGKVTPEEYTLDYQKRVLNRFDPVEVYERLTRYYTGEVVLLCYEKAGEFCHRRLVAEWLETANGVVIPEL